MPWTEQQKLLIQGLKDRNLLVSAAAGSGKTMVLVERILHFISWEGVDIHRLLVVTFTKKAAAEMRHRIQESLGERLGKGQGEESNLRRQLELLNRSSIKTLHSFCLDLLQDHFHLIPLDPAFRLGEPSAMNLLAEEALEEYLASCYQEGEEEFSQLVDTFGSKWGDGELKELILETYRFMHSHPQPFSWLEKAVQLYKVKEEDLYQHPWILTIKDRLSSHLQAGSLFLQRARELCEKPQGPVEYLGALEEDFYFFQSLSSLLAEDLDSFLTQLQERKSPRLKPLRGKRKEEVPAHLVQEVQALRDLFQGEWKAMVSLTDWGSKEKAHEILTQLHSFMGQLVPVIQGFHNAYQEKKFSQGLLDYSDLEHLALQILEDEEVARSLKEEFHYIFVDEYQDSNPVQEEILNRIRRERNLFMVGDVRQSIYRFRLADPTLFLEKYQTFTPYQDDPTSSHLRVDLQKNFRSRGEVIQGVNDLFVKLTSPTLGEMTYPEEAFLKKGLSWDWVGEATPQLLLLEGGEQEEWEGMDRIQVEAQVIAKKIKELTTQMIHLPGEDAPRKITYGDMVILLRSPAGKTSVYQEVFYQEGIPLHVDRGGGLFSSVEVQVLLNLLQVLDNRRQDLPLLSVLHSPVGGFQPDELATIRQAHPQGSFYAALTHTAQGENPLGKKVASFLETLNDWAQKARYVKVAELLWELLLESGLYRQAGGLPGGERRQASLRFLVEKARELEQGSITHLFDFLLFLKGFSQEEAIGTPTFEGEEGDVVRLMSVHKSKGLEFPIVIMGDLGRAFHIRDIYGRLLLHRDLGVGLTHVDLEKRVFTHSLAHRAIKEKKRQEILSEELRILYVALTRARDRFILVGTVKNLADRCRHWLLGYEPGQLLNASCYLDWIGAVLASHPGGGVIRRLAGISKDEDPGDSSWRIILPGREKSPEGREVGAGGKKKTLLSFQKEEISTELEEALGWSYPHQETVHLPTKLSVSRVGDDDISHIHRDAPSLSSRGEALQRGTLMHTVMRHLPHQMGPLDLPRELERMVEKGWIQEEDLPLLEVNQIQGFLESQLGKRMMAAPCLFREIPFVLRKKACQVLPETESHEEILIQGIIDAFFLENGAAVLVDYKTGQVQKKHLTELKKRYQIQVRLYGEAILANGWPVKESYLYFFSYGAVLMT